MTAVFDLIPGIGATIRVDLVSIILLSQGLWLSLKAWLICIVLQQIKENRLIPRMMQGSGFNSWGLNAESNSSPR